MLSVCHFILKLTFWGNLSGIPGGMTICCEFCESSEKGLEQAFEHILEQVLERVLEQISEKILERILERVLEKDDLSN